MSFTFVENLLVAVLFLKLTTLVCANLTKKTLIAVLIYNVFLLFFSPTQLPCTWTKWATNSTSGGKLNPDNRTAKTSSSLWVDSILFMWEPNWGATIRLMLQFICRSKWSCTAGTGATTRPSSWQRPGTARIVLRGRTCLEMCLLGRFLICWREIMSACTSNMVPRWWQNRFLAPTLHRESVCLHFVCIYSFCCDVGKLRICAFRWSALERNHSWSLILLSTEFNGLQQLSHGVQATVLKRRAKGKTSCAIFIQEEKFQRVSWENEEV